MQYSRIAASAVDCAVLGEPLTFRHGKQAKNRIMKVRILLFYKFFKYFSQSPMSEKLYNWNEHADNVRGLPTKAILNLYEKWGHGGYGLLMTGNMAVDPNYIGEAGQGIISRENINDSSKKILRKLATAMKSDGALAIAQINHIGNRAITEYTNHLGQKNKIVDKVVDPIHFSKKQLQDEIFDRFASAAAALHESGFDGIELHSAHGMIFNQFLAPKHIRDDEYGGCVENRARLLLDTYHAIRKVVPEDTGFLVGVKLNSRDFQEGGITREDIVRVCELIEVSSSFLITLSIVFQETGFDFVELTGGAMETVIKEVNQRQSTISRENFFFDFVQFTSQIFKKTVVYITGRWQTANAMVDSVNIGLTKGVALGRWSCSEPDFPKKLIAGEVFSCVDNKFAPSEFGYAKMAAHWQMKQMSDSAYDSEKG